MLVLQRNVSLPEDAPNSIVTSRLIPGVRADYREAGSSCHDLEPDLAVLKPV